MSSETDAVVLMKVVCSGLAQPGSLKLEVIMELTKVVVVIV